MAAAGSNSSDDVPILQAENLISNVKSIYYSRTFLSIIGGVVAGIAGFTGLTGFVFYFLIMMVASLGLLAKSKFSVHTYFDSWSRVLIEGIFGGLMVLTWSLWLVGLFMTVYANPFKTMHRRAAGLQRGGRQRRLDAAGFARVGKTGFEQPYLWPP